MPIEHLVVHKGTEFHSAFPHIIRLQNGDLVTVFRQAPFREEMAHYHLDSGSRIALVRSKDDGRTWNPDTHVVIDHSDGLYDLNMAMIAQHAGGELIVNNHRWHMVPHDQPERIRELSARTMPLQMAQEPFGKAIFDGLYFMRSQDNGHTWSTPQRKEISSLAYFSHTGKDGIFEMPDGSWLTALCGRCRGDAVERVFMARSYDKGESWTHPTTVAHDPEGKIGFDEPPLLILPGGRMIIVTRTSGADGYLYQAFSDDGGWTWQGLKRTPLWGFPCHLLRLESGRILCAFGYRREPFGIRVAISDDGLTWDADRVKPLRTDGLHRDLGYPASIQLKDGRILTVYYFHGQDGVRYIGGTVYSETDL